MKKKVASQTKTAPQKLISLTQHNADIKRYIGAVSEDFQHSVSAIAEQFSGLNQKLDEQGRKLDEHGKKLDEHGRKLDTHTEMIGRLMVDVEDIKVNMHEKVSRAEFNKLETRLVSLESFVFSGKQNIAGKKK